MAPESASSRTSRSAPSWSQRTCSVMTSSRIAGAGERFLRRSPDSQRKDPDGAEDGAQHRKFESNHARSPAGIEGHTSGDERVVELRVEHQGGRAASHDQRRKRLPTMTCGWACRECRARMRPGAPRRPRCHACPHRRRTPFERRRRPLRRRRIQLADTSSSYSQMAMIGKIFAKIM